VASLGALKRGMALTLILLFGVLFALLMVISFFLGLSLLAILILVLLFMLIQWLISPLIIAWSTHLRYLKKGENKFFEDVVQEICKKSNVPIPKLAVVEDSSPNAFVFGRTMKSSTLAVHTGLLHSLNGDEIRGVIGHEIGHLKHKDVMVMTFASAIPLLAYVVARAFFFGTRGARKGKSAVAIVIVAIISYAVYVIAQLLVLRLSRMREFYADSHSALVTGDPHSLSSALAKITYGLSLSKEEAHGARAFYIGDPVGSKREIRTIMSKKAQYDLDGDGVLDEKELESAMEREAEGTYWANANALFSTHPPTFKRILLLKQIEEDIKGGSFSRNIYKRI
jgi:heat shock protein HtpX